MTEERRDYGPEPEPEGSGGGARPGGGVHAAVSPRDENTWSVLAHLSIFLNLVTGFLGPVAALIIWLVYRERSPKISFHALQSLWYQVAWLVIIAVGWTITIFLTVIIIGIVLIPVMIALTLAPLVHAAYAAYKVNQGVDYRYVWIADMVSGNRRIG